MNILTFVLAILLVLTYGAVASFQHHTSSRRSTSAYIGLRKAERSLLRQSEGKTFKTLAGESVEAPTKHSKSTQKPISPQLHIPAVNPPCCRLNLFPLLEEGKEVEHARYELAAKMLRLFYGKDFLNQKKGLEYRLLDAMIESAKKAMKEQGTLAIETLSLADSDLQPLYYLLLKGTKHADLFSAKGHPPLIDFIKIERDNSPICLFHAHPYMLAPFFGLQKAMPLYEKLHREVKGSIKIEALIALANDPTLAMADPDIWKLLDLKKHKHTELTETLVAEDRESGILIRRDIQGRKSS